MVCIWIWSKYHELTCEKTDQWEQFGPKIHLQMDCKACVKVQPEIFNVICHYWKPWIAIVWSVIVMKQLFIVKALILFLVMINCYPVKRRDSRPVGSCHDVSVGVTFSLRKWTQNYILGLKDISQGDNRSKSMKKWRQGTKIHNQLLQYSDSFDINYLGKVEPKL